MPNFVTPLGPLGHLWSIGLEEQFYLVWPWIVRRRQALFRFALGVVLVKLISSPVVALIGQESVTNLFVGLRWESMAIGAIGALMFHRNHSLLRHLCGPAAKVLALAGAVCVALVDVPLNEPAIVFTSLLFVVLILNLVTDTRLSRPLETPLLTTLGQASYGIYMVHYPLLYLILLGMNALHVEEGGLRNLALYGTTVGGPLIVALVCYRLYESPFLALKERFAIVRAYR